VRGIAISNIVLPDGVGDIAACAAFRRLGYGGIELAPGKSVTGWPVAPAGLAETRTRIEGEGLAVVALQAILFGITGVALFGPQEARARLYDHLAMVARFAGALGARACVFGAPGVRDPGDLAADAAFRIAADFFGGLAPAFEREGTTLAFEANAPAYGCKFGTTTREALELVRSVDHAGFRLQIDTGTIFLNQEDPDVIVEAAPYASHFHVSEPQLAVLGSSGVDHGPLAEALGVSAYQGWISAEMKANEHWEGAAAGAAELLSELYMPSAVLGAGADLL
jgi:D-psicose/D-tagatose/L-ribulose 3-epimerase